MESNIFEISFDFDWRRRFGNSIRDVEWRYIWFNLRDWKYQMNSLKVIRKPKGDRVWVRAPDDFKGTEELFRKLASRSGGGDKLC